ncbi:hypothetical protein DL767_002304 [Monosporascus sp. MG133]|nr:hypothetical protein DL767_002304 [Monosporascus sp. MG133]
MGQNFATPGALIGMDFAGEVYHMDPEAAELRPDLKIGDMVCDVIHGSNPAGPDNGAFAEFLRTPAGLVMKNHLESGLTPIAMCSPKNVNLAKSYGAEAVFDYASQDASGTIRKHSGGRLRHALDCITDKESVECCYQAIGRTGGSYVALELVEDELRTRGAVKYDFVMALDAFGRDVELHSRAIGIVRALLNVFLRRLRLCESKLRFECRTTFRKPFLDVLVGYPAAVAAASSASSIGAWKEDKRTWSIMPAPRAATHWKRTHAAVDEPSRNSENRPILIIDSAKLEKWIGLYLPHRESAIVESAVPGILTSDCWTDWLALDIAADLAYNLKLSDLLNSIDGVNFFGIMNQIMKKFPLLTPLMFLVIPVSVIRSLPLVLSLNSKEVQARIERRGKTEHLDYFEQLCLKDGVVPTGKKRRAHLGQVAGQLMLAGFDPIANQFYSTVYFLTQEPQVFSLLKKEVRDTIKNYNDINPHELAPFEISSHLPPGNTAPTHQFLVWHAAHQPRPKGSLPNSEFCSCHSPRYFKDPRSYQPQRWLTSTHTHYDEAFRHHHLKGLWPFSQGPRMCLSRESAWVLTKLSIAKVVWSFGLEMAPGQDFDWERDMKHYSMWQKPELFVKFIPV